MDMKRTSKHQAGSVILEALIAILIFSIGILALVGMQAIAINNVSDAKYRSSAGFLANQIMGTIWASRLGTTAANASNVMVASPDPSFACGASGAGCTTTNGNTYTQAWIASGVAADLPRGAASITINGSTVTVFITWQSPKDTAAHQHIVSSIID